VLLKRGKDRAARLKQPNVFVKKNIFVAA